MTEPAIARPSKMLLQDWEMHGYPMPDVPYRREEGKEPVVDLGNGHKLHAQEYGNPDGEPVIVLHGSPGAVATRRMSAILIPRVTASSCSISAAA